jgi:DNA-binding response OmpR family regulator
MKRKILLIEDDVNIIDIYKTVLDFNSFDLEIFSWGEKAIEKIKQIEQKKERKPDLVLLDLILPDMNGIDILREIRKNQKTSDVPVFILTNYNSKELETEAYNLKAERFILKTNCTPTELINVIKERFKIS